MDIIARGLASYANERINGLESVGTPYIQNKYWYVWNKDTQSYVNSGIKAEGIDGENGYSPNITIKTNTDTTYILTITYKNENSEVVSFDTPNLINEGVGQLKEVELALNTILGV